MNSGNTPAIQPGCRAVSLLAATVQYKLVGYASHAPCICVFAFITMRICSFSRAARGGGSATAFKIRPRFDSRKEYHYYPKMGTGSCMIIRARGIIARLPGSFTRASAVLLLLISLHVTNLFMPAIRLRRFLVLCSWGALGGTASAAIQRSRTHRTGAVFWWCASPPSHPPPPLRRRLGGSGGDGLDLRN